MAEGWSAWTADCHRCKALCCVLLPFDAGEDFGHDKPALHPCHHLRGVACRLHGGLEAAGYRGCARYDCLGAGQRAVALLPEAPLSAVAPVFDALRRLHEDHLMLIEAEILNLPPEAEARRVKLLAALAAEAPQTPESLAAYLAGPLPGAVRLFLRGLKTLLPLRR